ncbi:MAG: type II toxin-antitoxin system RelE/ParE family toxin [Gammaproteobacteria bacterium]|nr:type II toxin-antitoxin system RelE/ParE family toxin [Pseudomonadota bacterium]MBT6665232.1 type II toxin-antitoxin system RelE/ParE family toxin [Gammaproteobacteria bacterium]MBT6950905.1 type II toxin-antitoxin system RelE/ParE family toxin [Gammaproteobacteria bacterium]MBT7177615.1 type II toxin-antitoxin system RelE/ParE family toxin [Gammaproteobacteria bacterium]
MPYTQSVFTVIETPFYSRKAEALLSDSEREEFAVFISRNPTAGSVVRGSGGVRKVRWARSGAGKSGGVRVIYYNMLEEEEVWLLTLYAKNERSTIPGHELKLIKEAIERG